MSHDEWIFTCESSVIYNMNFDGIIKEKDNNTEEDKEPYNIKSIIAVR